MCEDEGKAIIVMGSIAAGSLGARLADIDAVETAHDLVSLELGFDLPPTLDWHVTLDEGWVLHFTPNHPSRPVDADGNLDYSKVRRVRITDIRKP